MSTLGPRLADTAERLAGAGVADARLEADLLWMTALGLDRAELYARLNDAPRNTEALTAETLIARRLQREPLAYLRGTREFYGLALAIVPGVFVPRPETETLVEEALRLLQHRGPPSTVADIGCGSGAIAIALASILPDLTVYATDVSPLAVELTKANSQRHGVADAVHVLRGDLMWPLPRPVDLIVANLPYVSSAELATLDPEVRLFEPTEALDGGQDGLAVVRRLLRQAPEHLAPGGALLLEMDPRQVAAAGAFAAEVMPGARLRSARDLAGDERVLIVENAA